MRRFIFIFITAVGVLLFSISCTRREDVPKTEAQLYFVDSNINMLLPYSTYLTDASKEYRAKGALEALIEGRDDNDKIRRLIPKKKDILSCRVEDNTAYVDIKAHMADGLPQSRDIERLLIYQIVDTLTSIKGIHYVKFTVDGRVHKDFMGYYDMRETYVFSYPE